MKLFPAELLVPISFACLTALCWGLYGPALQFARSSTGEWSPFKPYVFTGMAYLIWAVLGGLVGMYYKQDSFNFLGSHSPSMVWGFLAGSVGAFGALFLTSAMLSGGKPLFVMPIVFGGAVTVTAIVSVIQLKQITTANPLLWVGMVLVFVGVVLVARNTPHAHPPKAAQGAAPAAANSTAESRETSATPSA